MDRLIYALQDVIESRQAESKAREEYSGYSWGYVGAELIERRHIAEQAFAVELQSVIDSAVLAALAKAVEESA